MANKPRETNREARAENNVGTFDERSFVDGVFNDEYILVVGSGVVLDRHQFPHSGGDINQYIIDEINSTRREKRMGFVDHKSFTDIYMGTARNDVDAIYSLLTSDDFAFDLSDISSELTQLLRTKLFKFVLTTTIDSYVETLMRDIWGEELRIVNVADNTSLKDLRDALKNSRVNNYSQPTLFYVFGKVIKGRPRQREFVETDVDAIRYIEKWLKEIDSEYIVPFLKKKRMLALGCKFDDWYFRFFWYILTRGFNGSDREGPKDDDNNLLTTDNLATMFDPNSKSDQQLKEYLLRRGVCMHDDVWSFMIHIHKLLTSTDENSPFRQMILEKRRQGGIFISYKSCDVLAASELFCKLAREKGLNVWFDNVSLNVGDDYAAVIRTAIHQAHIFIPILSPSIANELEKQGETISTFYSEEWRWAAENPNITVFPVAIDGYDLRSEANKTFVKIVGHQPTTGADMTQKPLITQNPEKVGYAKLLESIMKHLGCSES